MCARLELELNWLIVRPEVSRPEVMHAIEFLLSLLPSYQRLALRRGTVEYLRFVVKVFVVVRVIVSILV
jgi:hypothetical protein